MFSRFRSAAVTLALALAALAVWAQDVEVSPGYDLFTTDPNTTNLLGIPFVGDAGAIPVFDFDAPPASAARRRAIGDTDTIVHRLEAATVPAVPGVADPIAIEVVMLRLRSANKLADTDNDGTPDEFIYVTLQKDRDPTGEPRIDLDNPMAPPEMTMPGLRSFGEMTIAFDSADGGTFSSDLRIYADLRLGSPDGPIVCGGPDMPPCDTFDAGLTLASVDAPWGRNPAASSIAIRGVNFSLGAPDRSDPEDTGLDFWAGVTPDASMWVCVEHGGHEDPGGDPTRHGTCRTSCTTEPISAASCNNGKDDDCNGTIDDCDEDQFGPVVTAPPDLTFECPVDPSALTPADTGFATATDNCFPPDLPQGNISFQDFITPGCGETYIIDRVWSAVDDCGNDAASPDLQRIFVVDTTPPAIDFCPPEATILWTHDRSPEALGYAAGSDRCGDVAIDWSDESVPGVCLSETATRTWTATDECGNQSTCTQIINIRGPKDSIDDLNLVVESLGLPKGIENSLSAKLRNAARSVCRGNVKAATGQLGAFINEVEAQRGKKIAEADADRLIAAAQAILDALATGGACPDGCN